MTSETPKDGRLMGGSIFASCLIFHAKPSRWLDSVNRGSVRADSLLGIDFGENNPDRAAHLPY
jgi:hypothetical protein